MSEPERDVLAELDSLGEYLTDLASGHPDAGHGQDSNLADLGYHLGRLKDVPKNLVTLAGEYADGVTHEQRVNKSMGFNPEQDAAEAAQARIRDLEAQLAEARGGSEQDG